MRNEIFAQSDVDSGSLNMLTQVVHQFKTPGAHRGAVLRNGKPVGAIAFTVSEHSDVMQLDIDLAEAAEPSRVRLERPQLERPQLERPQLERPQLERPPLGGARELVVSPKGYVVFYVSRGAGGLAAAVGPADAKSEKEIFDTRTLQDGDLFVTMLLQPGVYGVTNATSGAKSKVTVAEPKVGRTAWRSPEALAIDCTEKGFRMERAEAVSTQGQIYRIGGPSRIRIALEKSGAAGENEPQRRKTTWRKQP